MTACDATARDYAMPPPAGISTSSTPPSWPKQHTARIKQLQTEVPAAESKRETLLAELHTLNDKLNELKAAIGNTTRPARERSHLEESVRRIETKHAVIFNTEAVR